MQGENGGVELPPPPPEVSHQDEDAEDEDDERGPQVADIEHGSTKVSRLWPV